MEYYNQTFLIETRGLRFTITPESTIYESDFLSDLEYVIDYKSNNKHGIVYFSSVDQFYLIITLSDIFKVFTPITVEDSMAVYFNLQSLIEEAIQIFKNDPKSKILVWNQYVESVIDFSINIHDDKFDDRAVTFLHSSFGDYLVEILMALNLEIPIILTNVSESQMFQFMQSFLLLLPDVRISKKFEIETPSIHIYLLSDKPEVELFDEYLYLDMKTQTGERLFKVDTPLKYKNIVAEALEFHKDRIMPFQISIIMKIFWSIQKVFGILALNGEYDFANYLYDEELDQVEILMRVFNKLAYFKI
ncbi:MAG: hypothetical protein INQ03_12585 [Candidatus Heimdallarchaeota archaeon]|nr:hypothetical protein [Candidatus Heimdallarchaeota archaeon]